MINYDPYSHEAMLDPTELYRAMRAEGCPHRIEKYNAWALTRFDDVVAASMKSEALDFTHGQTPGQVLLGEPIPHTFMTMNQPEARAWRGVLAPFFTPAAIEKDRPRIERLVRDVLTPLIGRETVDVFGEYCNRVLCINAGYNLGLDPETSLRGRALIDDILLGREPGQIGASSPANQAAAQKLYELLAGHLALIRKSPERAGPLARALLDAEVNGKRLNDEEMMSYLFSMLVVGSETTPLVTAGALYYLAKHPEQKAQVLADLSLCKAVFHETCRYDQPTNMLARRARADFELSGRQIRSGDGLLFIYASANRDEAHFDRPDAFDINRKPQSDVSFGVGLHYCLGMHLAVMVGEMMLRELLSRVEDYDVVDEGCTRAYGEHLNGFIKVTIRPRWKR